MRYLLVGLSTRCLAESAWKAGRDVVSVDFFGDLDLERMCESISLRREYHVGLGFDPFLFVRASENIVYDRLVYLGPLENYPGVLERFAERCEIVGNDADTVRRVRDWKNVRRFCEDHGFFYPETFDGVGYVVKPKKSGGGTGIRRLSSQVVQKFIKGEHFSASFLGDGRNGEVVSVNEQLIGRKEFGARDFWYCGNITPVFLDRKEIDDICRRLVEEFSLKGSCGVDFVVRNRLYLLEVNPRPQATLEIVERAFDVNMFSLHEKAFAGRVERMKNPGKTWGKAILYAEEDITMPDTGEWLDLPWVRDIPHPFEAIPKSAPVLTVIAEGSDRDDCFEHLREKVGYLKERIYNGFDF